MKGSRTIGFNSVMLMVASVLIALGSDPSIQAILPPEYLPHILAVVALLNIVLRFVTTTPVFKGQ